MHAIRANFSKLLSQCGSRLLMPKRKAAAFYAVANGRTTGIFSTWDKCQEQINGFANAKFKKFDSSEEAQAFVDSGTSWKREGVPAKKSRVDQTVPSTSTSSSSKSSAYYAVARGTSTGVFLTWSECQSAIRGFKSPKFKKFTVRAEAEEFVAAGQSAPAEIVTATSSTRDIVYTDGSCLSNGKSSGATAGCGVFWGDDDPRNKAVRLAGDVQTNNRAELQACIYALETAKTTGMSSVRLATDSQYTIKCVTEWAPNWEKKGWKTAGGQPVKNVDLLRTLMDLCDRVDVEWQHVAAHCGIHGNEMADSLANQGARLPPVL